MLLPVIGPLIARAETKTILRLVMAGGVQDPRKLPAELIDDMSGWVRGQGPALRDASDRVGHHCACGYRSRTGPHAGARA
jgi:hypothetical protein